jgi:hypothetical protein
MNEMQRKHEVDKISQQVQLMQRKTEFVKLMRQKRGVDYTLGWLESSYVYARPAETELLIISEQTELLLALPDYPVVFRG